MLTKQLINDQHITIPGNHLYWIDLIRFLAAFAVLACHFRGAFFVDYGSLPGDQQTAPVFAFFASTRLGHEAVLIFFILSGFLVGGKSLERILNKTFKPLDYSIDRTVRIMLPLLSSLALFIPICLYADIPINLKDWLGNILSLQGIICPPIFETLWSLSYEVWFYILMCAFGYCIINKGKAKIYIGIFTLIVSFAVFIKLHSYFLFIWLIGAFGYFIIPQKSTVLKYATFILSCVFLCILQLSSEGGKTIPLLHESRIFSELIFSSVFCLFMVQLVLNIPSNKISIKLNRVGTRLAAFSYTLYLTHIPVRDILIHLGAPKSQELSIYSVSLYIAWLLLALVVAYGIYWIFERNTSKVKMFIKAKISQ